HKLKNITPDCVVYTGTHDIDTTKGWFDSLPDYDKKHVLTTLELKTTQADENTGEMAINVVN
ncbi:MAG: 4-alpha-glucanotransferase, partial [Spirochaetia bacterium]